MNMQEILKICEMCRLCKHDDNFMRDIIFKDQDQDQIFLGFEPTFNSSFIKCET